MAIPKKNTAGKKKIVKKQNEMLVAANSDPNFKQSVIDNEFLSASEFDALIADPTKKSLVIDLYKFYLGIGIKRAK
mgnify:CR=1 FL=1|tara:strand:- start:221 stop:448 length:228 start_codon:yes stop_codon:yes gene_type:complete